VPPTLGYTVLPLVYDRWQKTYGKDYSSLIFPRLKATIRQLRIPTSSMLDLACGTGSLALMMARRGWKVFGVDASDGMLAAAHAKAARSRAVQFFHQDMRDVDIPDQVDLVTSMFDSVNHLPTPADLLATFRSAFDCLNPGGYFVFDTNNERCYTLLWTRTETAQTKDFTLILQNSYNQREKVACSRVTLFLRKGEQYTRHYEVVCERCFSRREMRVLLKKAGFAVVKQEDFNFTANPLVGKIKTWWVARKPGDGPARCAAGIATGNRRRPGSGSFPS